MFDGRPWTDRRHPSPLKEGFGISYVYHLFLGSLSSLWIQRQNLILTSDIIRKAAHTQADLNASSPCKESRPLLGQLVQPVDVAHHGHYQHHREPARTEHGQPQIAHSVNPFAACQLLDLNVQRVHALIHYQVMHSLHISEQLRPQGRDGVHLSLHLVAQCVRALYALQQSMQ